MAWFWRRAPDPPFTVEELVTLAEYSADREEWARALGFVRLAIKKAPTSARLRMDEGYFLESLGRTKAALESYRKASELTAEGDPLFHVGRLLLGLGQETAAVEALAAALDRSPELVLDIDGDPELEVLVAVPGFSKARRNALGRL